MTALGFGVQGGRAAAAAPRGAQCRCRCRAGYAADGRDTPSGRRRAPVRSLRHLSGQELGSGWGSGGRRWKGRVRSGGDDNGEDGGGVASERDAWSPNIPRAPPVGAGASQGVPPLPPTPRTPPPWDPAFWLPGDSGLRTRRMALVTGTVLAGSFFLRKILPADYEPPRVYSDEKGQRYLKTDGGSYLALFEDDQGRPYFLDPKGNMWYDSGDPEIGMHRIDRDGDVFALWEDPKTGEVSEKRLGNIDRDLVNVKTKEYGDLTVFKDNNSYDVPPLCKDETGNLVTCLDPSGKIRTDRKLEYPEVMVEGQIKDLKRRKQPFKKQEEVRPGDKDINTFRQGNPKW